MDGLINVNILIKKLIEEVRSIDYQNYENLVIKKNRAYDLISKGNYSDHFINEVKDKVLPDQIKFFEYYENQLPRILRIFRTIENGKKNISPELQKESASLLAVLNEVMYMIKAHIFSAGIVSILKEQKSSLDAGNFDDFNKLYKKEAKKLSEVYKILKKLKIDADYSYSQTYISRKKSFILKASIVLILYTITSSYYIFKDVQVDMNNLNGKNLSRVIEEYEKKDLLQESKLETDFESTFGVDILGDYTEMDLDAAKVIMIYGKNIFKELNLKRILFVPASDSKNLEEAEITAGLAFQKDRTTIALASGIPVYSGKYGKVPISIILHELSHVIHYKIAEEHPEFNKEWEKINGGYIDPYQRKNIFEDIAVLNERVIMNALNAITYGRKMDSFVTIDKNPEALNKKIQLLKDHGFFPKNLKIHL